jgi:ammonium transporter Rh
MVDGLFAAIAVLISYGATIGKVGPAQLVFFAFVEVIFYGLNIFICSMILNVFDIGGSLYIHTFGAYFGLALSKTFSTAKSKGRRLNAPSYASDTFAMIGTIFLFIYWPSFNAAFADATSRLRAVANTLLGLVGSVVAAFVFSRLWAESDDPKLDMVHIQNSTLAGGVALGAIADLHVNPAGALGIGTVAGALSVFGYVFLTPALERSVGLQDTCGIHNLHGMPGILSVVCSSILARMATPEEYGAVQYATIFVRGNEQTGYQVSREVLC